MASTLGVPESTRESTREMAGVIYRRALDDRLPGWTVESVATAALYAASRMDNAPRSIDEVSTVSRVK